MSAALVHEQVRRRAHFRRYVERGGTGKSGRHSAPEPVERSDLEHPPGVMVGTTVWWTRINMQNSRRAVYVRRGRRGRRAGAQGDVWVASRLDRASSAHRRRFGSSQTAPTTKKTSRDQPAGGEMDMTRGAGRWFSLTVSNSSRMERTLSRVVCLPLPLPQLVMSPTAKLPEVPLGEWDHIQVAGSLFACRDPLASIISAR